MQPLVVNGFVVARRGQTFGGRVAEAVKAGRAKGTSRLGLEINEISLVDGQQLPVKTQLISRRGDSSVGRDAVAIGTTTGVGAAVGAAADGGTGAGIGALAGAAASTIGVLMTRGKPTVVYPEMVLTFRMEAPLNISTERSAAAFQPVIPEDYEQQPTLYRRGPRQLHGQRILVVIRRFSWTLVCPSIAAAGSGAGRTSGPVVRLKAEPGPSSACR